MSDPRFHPPGRSSVAQILAATGGELVRGPIGGDWTLCTDSRLMADGAVFVALRGEIHDGHAWVTRALQGKRAGALVEQVPDDLPDDVGGPIIRVPDTLVALGDVARAFLLRQSPAVAAITGSVGKTTTRAMLASILEQLGPGLCTEGNFNNRIGVPLTLLQLQPEHRWAVLEMGMSEPGEIRLLADLARPRVRVITWVSEGHLEFFDSVAQIADAKGELFEAARPGDQLVYPHKAWFAQRLPRPAGSVPVTFGHGGADVFADQVEELGLAGTRARLILGTDEVEIELPLPGRHQLHNAMAAVAAARCLGAGPEAIAAGLKSVELPGRRMRIETIAGVTVVDDAYNANPASVRAALETAASLPRDGRLVAALGDMLELGPQGPDLHGEVGATAAMQGFDLLVAAGPLMARAVEGAAMFRCEAIPVQDAAAAADLLVDRLEPGDLLLVKGSRSMRMERVIEALRTRSEP